MIFIHENCRWTESGIPEAIRKDLKFKWVMGWMPQNKTTYNGIELKVAYVKQIPNLTISFLHAQIRPILLENYTTWLAALTMTQNKMVSSAPDASMNRDASDTSADWTRALWTRQSFTLVTRERSTSEHVKIVKLVPKMRLFSTPKTSTELVRHAQMLEEHQEKSAESMPVQLSSGQSEHSQVGCLKFCWFSNFRPKKSESFLLNQN